MSDASHFASMADALRAIVAEMRHQSYPPYVHGFADRVERALASAALAYATQQTAPVAQGDALPREDFAWLVVQEACETEPADEDDPECIRILRRDLKSAVLAAFLRHDAAHPQRGETQ